jgi:hypothetical protein
MRNQRERLTGIVIACLFFLPFAFGGFYGSLFALDAFPEDRWALWRTYLGMPLYFALMGGFLAFGSKRPCLYDVSVLLSIFALVTVGFNKDYLLQEVFGEPVIISVFCGGVLFLGCLSLFIRLDVQS